MRHHRHNRLRISTLFLLLIGGCQKAPELAPPPSAATGGVRLEIQYNAIRALAYRGSDAMKDPGRLDVLAEMLDEQKQLQHFRLKLKDGRDVPDQGEAQTTVESALKAIAALHRKRPEIDLSRLYPAIEQVAQGSNEVLKQEARKTQVALGIK
ncbi:MAG: hypothetical protein JNM56_18875 [Planctomycetia bacterium]|nr:hypothetical protein [Planctomycetia bacterium]